MGIHPGKENFFAYLGEEQNGDIAVLAIYEFHGTHVGWHIHAVCGDEDDVIVGKQRDHTVLKRVPSSKSYHRRKEFSVTKENAVDFVARVFGLYNPDQYDLTS